MKEKDVGNVGCNGWKTELGMGHQTKNVYVACMKQVRMYKWVVDAFKSVRSVSENMREELENVIREVVEQAARMKTGGIMQ